jgi:hypothetical protein
MLSTASVITNISQICQVIKLSWAAFLNHFRSPQIVQVNDTLEFSFPIDHDQ